ncbi:glycosyltransferase family 2 protein [Serratia sp. Lou2A]|jgi:glycosyltransferase involved in cell wall biosynthesis|uniref:Glycosyl transferase family 2 n=2 Tax=Serratia TaxID=613 RepID=A0A380AAY7_SERMA|nr:MULTISPECIES: glycosyltransferase family A protein [Serratia]ELQ9308060.1 glycosyltransferase family 2 protein [Serratia marcescens]ELQ9437845.1 glycosyltransferase family 2 protein [Serratia marcescens]ELT5558182.1 glycosyltransferase family 2 protein [Serratia marcescens]KFL02735.1 glycosyl transferase 2 family protein [Serratia marcescens]MBH2577442.1 glycosyltransferase family 2 protein [Serratia marcescens]
MKGSVAIILRHHETRKRLLLRALESVKNQSYKKYEVFVMMSKFNISSDIEDLVLISGCDNVNVVASQDELINKLHSIQFEYVCFLDDDDTWAPEYLTRCLSIFEKSKDKYPSIGAVACHVNRVSEIAEGNRIKIDKTEPWNHYFSAGPVCIDALYYRNSIPISSCIFEYSAFMHDVKSYNILEPAFFWVFLISFMSRNDVWFIPESLSFYHFRREDDFNLGNYSIIHAEDYAFSSKIILNSMARNASDDYTCRFISSFIFNEAIFHRVTSIDNKISRLVDQ